MKNLIKFLQFTLLMFTYFNTYSQEQILSGIITDSLNVPIKYANVGILNKPVGTVTDDKGLFSFKSEYVTVADTLKFSCVGYSPKLLILKSLSDTDLKIVLKNYSEILPTIKISNKKLSSYTEGKDKTETKHSVIFANPKYKDFNLGTEIGKKFSLGSKRPTILNEFKFYIKENDFKNLSFRINIYTVQNNKPHIRVNKTDIIVNVQNSLVDWVTIDLKSYDIIVQSDIIICVEWIEKSNDGKKLNLPIIIPSFGSTHYYKFGSQGNWQRYSTISSSMVLKYQQ